MLRKHLIAETAPAANEKNIFIHENRRITILAPELFRIEFDDKCRFCDAATQTVWFRNADPVGYTAEIENQTILITTEKVKLILRESLSDSLIVFSDGKTAGLSNEENLLGTYRTLDCCDGDLWVSYQPEKGNHHPIRLENGVISRTGVALYDDSSSLLLKPDGMVEPRENEEKDLYLFAYGQDYRSAVKALYFLCGAPAAIPRYSLGNWWSRYHAYSENEYLELMEHFEEDNIPFTVATVDMDWHPSENLPEGIDGWTGYSWNKVLFPDYRRFLQKLHEKNLHVTLNLHPASGVQYIEDQYEEMAQRLGIDPSTRRRVDFNFTDPAFINAYFELLHNPYEDDGVDFWWIDWQQGCNSALKGYDPLWGLNHFHSLDIARNKDRLILSRYSGIGSHRYPIGFSGDTLVTWNTLRFLPYFTATASNAGYTWWSHDIGGHMSGIKDDELYVRFIQFGVFSPINRLHSSKSNTFSKMPDLYNNGTGEIIKGFLRLRHAMIPYLYSAMCENVEKGLALIEPMYYEYPAEEAAYQCSNQYLFGRQLLVAPITEKSCEYHMSSANVWLPEGKWTDIFTGNVYEGGKWHQMTRFMDSLPVLAKEGGFLVLDKAVNGNQVTLPSRLQVLCFNGNGEYTLYEDLGEMRAVTHFRAVSVSACEQVFRFRTEDKHHILPPRSYVLELRNTGDGEVRIWENGTAKECRVSHRNGYTRVHLENVKPNITYEVAVCEREDSWEKQNAFLQKSIARLEWDNEKKAALADALCRETHMPKRRELLEKAALPEIFKAYLCESLQ